ncbi:MAG: ATP-dependent RecD-like DNA helicase [Chlamydiales bacterium]|nr:ATP-dependent RecD-like DNA helicase [Chlamydiales bacterium]MCH9635018.1 ATP-dependent RecD-like DNA helicase [Chlamydiales bacterium]MCH9704278.1 ATP-dependent RecD-like DNA helicase [Chlamydiota bacterium]
MDQLFGSIERITFHNQENGFTVARLVQPRKKDLVTIVGNIGNIQPGESVRLLGQWKVNPQHGMQFQVQECHIETPSDAVGIQKYLESGMVRGIGPTFARRIVQKFKEKTLDVIDKQPDLLLDIEGVGPKRVASVKKSWREHQAIRSVMLWLQKYEVSPSYAQKLYKAYGEETVARLQENPFSLAAELRGIGFKTADRVAAQMGFPKDATQRIDSGIEHQLMELAGDGHTCFPREELEQKVEELLEISVGNRIEALVEEKKLIEKEDFVWSRLLYMTERGIAKELKRLSNGKSALRSVKLDKAIEWVEKELEISLATMQKAAVSDALYNKLQIITGGPGTGKSTITKAILAITNKLTRRIILAAPTGRAAKRMSEITKKEASTIHSLLQFDFKAGGFKRNRDNPLVCDLIIIDEASMIDTSLMYHLLKAIPDHARLLLIGDVNQLPSVGPGSVLQDLIESKSIPTSELTEIFRQAKGSKIITNAHRINAGEFPDLTIEKGSDFFFSKCEEPQEVSTKILDLVATRLPKSYNFDPIKHIQVLCPMKRGPIGTEALNRLLQEKINPSKEAMQFGSMRISVGDKVMQIRNNYDKEVYNGDIGQVVRMDRENQLVTVRFFKEVDYSFSEMDELVLAYACSVHKYQGSEAPCVVIPVHTSHFMMLHRNLLYTAVTRARKLVVLVGTGKAIAIAVSTNDAICRHTGLQQSIQETFALN